MDELGWSWPAWKFGMKRDDLFTKLHDKFNTLTTPIQDPEAFHHDVYEVSNCAGSKEEFHRLMAERKEQRLAELNAGLELASAQIISNPNLIATEQWPLAIQLFRARSLDALVRYFSSYLPDPHFDSDADTTDDGSSRSDVSRSSASSISTAATDVNSEELPTTTFFPEKEAACEPLTITPSIPKRVRRLSPPQYNLVAESKAAPAAATDVSDDDFILDMPIPASRSMSFSGSESDRFDPYRRDDTRSDVSEAETPPILADVGCEDGIATVKCVDECVDEVYVTPSEPAEIHPKLCQPDEIPNTFTPQHDGVESDRSTPRPQLTTTAFFTRMDHIAGHFRRSPSPCTRTRLAQCETRKSPRMRKRELSPQVARSPSEMLSRVQKPAPDAIRFRPRGRRKAEVE